jgi:tetratricopeptide (TPR) repeat protein
MPLAAASDGQVFTFCYTLPYRMGKYSHTVKEARTMKKIAAGLFFPAILFTFSVIFAQDYGKIADATFLAAKGKSFYDKGKFEEATESFENALKVRPEDPKATYYLVMIYLKKGEKYQALDTLKGFLEYINKESIWLGSIDREYVEQCKVLLKQLNKEMPPAE